MTEHPNLLLPFTALSASRKESITKEMERAAIYCSAEIERAKGGGLILKQPQERTALLVEFHYPFWLIPWNKMNLVFDGLGTVAHRSAYKPAPDLKAFTENIERSSKTQENYANFLSENTSYFRTPTSEKAAVIRGLLTDPNILNEFKQYLAEATKTETQPSEAISLTPAIDEPAVTAATRWLDHRKAQFQEEINALYSSMKFLNKATNNFIRTIRGKMKAVKEEFGKEIKKQETIVMPKVESLQEEYDEQVAKLAKDFEKQLAPLQKEKMKLQKVKQQALEKIEDSQVEAKASAARKDAVGERKWKEKANEGKKTVSELDKKTKDVEGKIKEVEENRSLETFRLRSENEAKIAEVKKDLLELEAEQDAKLQVHKQEIGKLQQLTSEIISQIDRMAKLREADVASFGKLGIPPEYEKPTLVLVPFYLASYLADQKRRYVLFPPSTANSVSLSAKLKGVLGMAKIKQFLTPRYKATAALLYNLPLSIEQNAVFERELNEAGAKANLLSTKNMQEQIRSGLEELNKEGWFTEKEFEAFKQAVESHS